MKFEIKGFKTWSTMDGGGYQFNLYVDGKKSFFVHNDGNGGCIDVHPYDTFTKPNAPSPSFDALMAHIKSLPQYEFMGKMFNHDMDTFMDGLVNEYEKEKQLKKYRKTNTLFRLLNDEKGTFRRLTTLDMSVAKDWLEKNHPNNYEFI
jgi:hypothetical protein